MLQKFKLAICQTKITRSKLRTLEEVENSISEAVSKGAQMILLPECFNSNFDSESLRVNAENFEDSVRKTPTLNFLRQYSDKFNVYIAGSIPEISDNQCFNTGLLFNPQGQLVLKQRKLHLWNINIQGRIQLDENKIFKAGNKISVAETEFGRIGMAIGYDLRFGQLSSIMAQNKKAQLLLYPCNFNQITGQLYWETLLKSRAIDNQCFVAGCNPAKDLDDPLRYQSYGHSAVIDPLGRIISEKLQENQDKQTANTHESNSNYQFQDKVEIAEIDYSQIQEVRNQLGTYSCVRNDVYEIVEKQ